MSKRLRTVEIEGYGPVQIRSLTKRQLENALQVAGDNEPMRLVHIIRRGMVDPEPSDEFLQSIRETPDVLADIATAIIERSWPNVEI